MPLTVTIAAPIVARVGGMERAMTELAEGLLERGHEVVVVARRCGLTPHPRLSFVRVKGPDRPAAISLPWFWLAGSMQVARYGRGLRHAQGAHVANRLDLVTVQFCRHAYRERANFPRRRRDTLPYRVNELLDDVISRGAERWAYRRSHTRRVVTVAHGVARELRRFFPDLDGHIDVIPNGVDLDAFRPGAGHRGEIRAELGVDGGLMALFVGGDWKRKGLRYVIEALPGAPGWSLVVVGEGDRRRFEALAASLGVGDRVHFAGRRADPAPIYMAADAFVFPSAYEAFPLAVLEAAASGLPLLVVRGNGTEELVRDDLNGYFVERDGGSIARCLAQLGKSPELRSRLGAGARRSVEDHSWENVVDAYIAVYRTLEGDG